ncbi:MAG: hypothetical protein EOT05_01240 [Candidatus Microsaccharimonas sossegonensis]|uniref:TrbL/VirB6 plasmid conjugal transfer protein n=1 Tax=Candidatus Microsaccharimonas sossegonensis TaxID=2506948 RepID=A0A4Q0AGU3_9BACT|nr:MAG: hypothetical protein EOT05_01240 [Candidatus Microsaccharimonas sossegonensis]
MRRFSTILRRLYSKNVAILLVLLIAVFGISSAVSVITNELPVNAANTYSYAENNSKIILKTSNGTSYILAKNIIQSNGKDQYNGSVKITGPDGKNACDIGVTILVAPGSSSGTISAPAYANGLAGAGAAGVTYTPSCPKNFAANSSEYNKSITIASSTSGAPAPANPESVGDKEGIVSTYSKTKAQPKASITRTVGSSSISDSKDIVWSTGASVGEARWENLVVGTSYKFCVTPTAVFDTQDCKTATKEYGKPLIVTFGSFETSYNPTGKQVTVTVRISIPAAPTPSTYGPVPLTIISTDTGIPMGTGETNTITVGKQVTVAQQINLSSTIDSIEPGNYKVCVTNSTKFCSAQFTKEINRDTTAEIIIGVDDAKTFLNNVSNASCLIEGVGWIVCPIITFMAQLADGAFGFLANNFLKTDPQVFNTSAQNGTFAAWSIMRTIANVVFVIVFLIIIFSQLTSLGVSNYGVKKMLPRLVIAAILVNLSYFISQLAIDLSNILGYSIKDMFNGISGNVADSTSATTLSTNPFNNGQGFVGIAGAVIATTLVGVAAYAMLSTLIPVLFAAVIALIMILLILTARQAIIILLVVISPLAFVAFLLPNTEALFTKWRKMLMAMLLLFPIIALVFGASQLTSQVLTSANVYKGSINGDSAGLFSEIAAAAILVLPLFIVPGLLKKSLDSIPVLGQMANKIAGRANGNIGNKLKESYATSAFGMGRMLQKAGAENYRKRRFAEKASKGGLYGALSKGIPLTPMQRAANKNVGRAASAAVDKAEAEDVSAEQANLERLILSGGTTADAAFTDAVKVGDTVKAKAALNIKFQTAGGRTEAHNLIASAEANPSFGSEKIQALQRHIASQHPTIDAQDSTLGRWSHGEADSAGNRDLLSLEVDPKTYELGDTKMAGQSKPGLVEAYGAGHLDAAAATRILDNDNLSKDLKPPEREFLAHIAAGNSPRPTDQKFR